MRKIKNKISSDRDIYIFDNAKSLSIFLKLKRNISGLGKFDFIEKRMQMERTTGYNYLEGRRLPNYNILIRLCNNLGYEVALIPKVALKNMELTIYEENRDIILEKIKQKNGEDAEKRD